MQRALDLQPAIRNDGRALSWIPFACVGVALTVLVVLGYLRGGRWAGLAATKNAEGKELQPAKTLWDWLQLLVIPLALAGLAFLLNNSQSDREQRREDERAISQRKIARDAAREEALRAYLAQMSDLILDRNLLRWQGGANVRAVARTFTLTVLRRVDGERKGLVVRFLDEAHLVEAFYLDPRGPKVELSNADLRFADLGGANMGYTELQGADLRGADFQRAVLLATSLQDADLRGADLRVADLREADFRGADLRNADLRGVHLSKAKYDTTLKLSKAKYDSNTRWPPGFDPVAAGANKEPD